MKKWFPFLLIWSLLVSLFAPGLTFQGYAADMPDMPEIENKEGFHHHYFIVPEHFQESTGSWTIQGYDGTLRGKTLIGRTDRNTDAVTHAAASVPIVSSNVYYVWAHTRDFASYPGQRQFRIEVDGQSLPYAFGAHGTDGWLWERGGRVQVDAGEAAVILQDSSAYYPRVDAILLTTDPYFTPAPDYSQLKEQVSDPAPSLPSSPYPDMPAVVNVPGYYANYFIVPEQFEDDPGTWTVNSSSSSLRGRYLQGKNDGQPSSALSAKAAIELERTGIYHVWLHTEGGTDNREFDMTVGGNELAGPLGGHGGPGWAWESGGRVSLKSGSVEIELLDTAAADARVDAVLLTADPEYVPNEAYDTLKEELALSRPVSEGPLPSDAVFLRPESFSELGTWSAEYKNDALGKLNLIGIRSPDDAVFDPETSEPAAARFEAPIAGTYKVWVHARDFSDRPGTRYFEVNVNGNPLERVFGQHGRNSWAWEDGGEVELHAGINELELVDTSGYYARTDGIFLTNDLNYIPSDSYQELLSITEPNFAFKDHLVFPDWALTEGQPDEILTLENEHLRVEFLRVATPQGSVIQKQTSIKQGNSYIPVDSREDEFGYLLLSGKESQSPGLSEQTPIFHTVVDLPGENAEVEYVTVNAFHSGKPGWLIPSSMTAAGTDTAILAAENELVRLEAEWVLGEGATDPTVTLRLEPKQDGAYSIGMFNGTEQPLDEVNFLLNPFRYHSKRLPVEPVLVTEQTSSSASSYMTVPSGDPDGGHSEVTYAITADPASIEPRWAYGSNSAFGFGIRGRDGGVLPSLFAPLLGLPGSQMDSGDSFEFTYRPVTRLAGWYDTYSEVVQQIMGVTDYRNNVGSSLTDTIFNVQDLMLDDHYGGWDPVMKAHYNMESKNVATWSNPLAALQAYRLTEDEHIIDRRAIPAMEYLLSRRSVHFSALGNEGQTIPSYPQPAGVGEPVKGFGTSVFGGVFEMTQGLSPAFREIGVDGGVRASDGNVPAWAEQLWMYRYTGDAAYLEAAKTGADAYLEQVVYADSTALPEYTSFIYMNYYANVNSLLDIYETTGDNRYLQGAEEAARWLLTTIRTFPVPEGNLTIDADELRSRGFMNHAHFWWRGSMQDRLGFPDQLPNLRNETVPAWVPSPVGLGVEQASTFIATQSAYITQSNWAPDLMRLAAYTGDDSFEMYARNAVLGRGENYPGYYQNQHMVHQKEENYPYTGPDLTNIYYHHIPVYYGLLTDFLFAQAWNWSNQQIDFPYLRQQGYAYFNNRLFGSAPGSFFGEEDMWPWLKRGLLNTNHEQIDWLAARKDGKFAAALMNEDAQEVTTTVAFGEDLGGQSLEGAVTIISADGTVTPASIVGGELTVTVPARGLIALMMDHPDVQEPVFAGVDPAGAFTRSPGQTVAGPEDASDFGQGHILQLIPSSYHAYVYITDRPEQTDKAILHYRIGGDGVWQQMERSIYPYEFSVKVDQPDALFEYYVEVLEQQGPSRTSLVKQLKPYRSGTDIIDFHIDGQIGLPIIEYQESTVTSVVYGNTDLSSVQPELLLSSGAKVQSAGQPLDFTVPVEVTVLAENGLKRAWTLDVYPLTDLSSLADLVELSFNRGWIANGGHATALGRTVRKGQYQAFLNQVTAFEQGGTITSAAARMLSDAADFLMAGDEDG